jgi:hypothetical protein
MIKPSLWLSPQRWFYLKKRLFKAQKLLRDEFDRAEGNYLKAAVQFYEEKCED